MFPEQLSFIQQNNCCTNKQFNEGFAKPILQLFRFLHSVYCSLICPVDLKKPILFC